MTGKTITSGSTAGYDLSNPASNPVTVASGVTITNTLAALYTELPTYWTIVNSGTLLATEKNAYSDGILLFADGGSVTNSAGASVGGYYVGVSVAGSGTVVNQGLITTQGTSGSGFIYSSGIFTANSAGVLLGGGGVSNAASGLISGYFEGIALGGGGSVVNSGTILAQSTTSGFGIVLTAGGSVTNGQGGTISGGVNGILALEQPSTVVNQGSIVGGNNLGVGLIAGGALTNATTGNIYGGYSGVRAEGTGSLTVTNAAGGTIAGGRYGVYGGTNNSSTLTNAGIVIGYSAVGALIMGGGTVDNEAQGQISGYDDGIFMNGTAASTITNSGSLYGYLYVGAWMSAGGTLVNAAGGSVFGKYYGFKASNDAGYVLNMGSISDTQTLSGAGVQLADGGSVTNTAGGTITSNWMGVQIGESLSASIGGTVINQGSIIAAAPNGDGAGIWIHGPGAISNAPSGLISGGGFGIVAYYQTTVVNQGTIYGTEYAFDAVKPGFADRIIDAPGGVFKGGVEGGNTLGSAVYSTLELASGSSTGTIANVGTFTDFGMIALDAGASWSLGGSIVARETIAFGGADASLILSSPSAAAATISGFAATDTIVLSGITDVTGLSFNAGNTLAVAESGGPGLALQFAAPLDLAYVVRDGSTDMYVPCFLPGTHILTDRGEVLVEKLQVGDTIATLTGRTRRLCWIGHGRALATRGRRSAATPVIVRKGALADNVPHLDLHITKGHSLYLDGVLIPVEFLVNHRSVLWDDRAQEVTVFHLELDAHDVLVANGAAAESYRDDGNRWLFKNANAGWDQPPKEPCAPVMTGGKLVDAVWRRLLDRCGPRPGLPLTDDPDLHLLIDGKRVDASEQQGLVWVFQLVRRPKSVRIASREAVPAELGLARDPRSLGVALRRIAVRQGSKFAVLKANDPQLVDGFHAYEAFDDLRWTDGLATLPAQVFQEFRGAVEVVLHLATTMQYPNLGVTGRTAA